MGHLKAYYEQLIHLTETEWHVISAYFHRRIFKKGELVCRSGETEKFLSFIEEGRVRYFIPDEDKELTFRFGFEREFVCAYESFLTQTPSIYAIETLAETIVWQINYDDLQNVYAITSAGNYLGRLAAEKLYLATSRRELSLLKYTATERYLQLFNEQPQVIKKIPQKYIAAYIGITPQALSRIRKEIC